MLRFPLLAAALWALLLVVVPVYGQDVAEDPFADVSLQDGSPAVIERDYNPDPFESINRKMFAFNNGLDRVLMRPLARGYQWAVPNRMKRGVGNFFANLYDFNAAINGALQWRWPNAGRSTGRFLVNSTIGILGFMDVATRFGLTPHRTDFGQTLAVWGAEPGPYLMVPLFGPRTVRSGIGTIFDTATSIQGQLDNVPLRNTLWGVELIDGRAALLSADQLLSGDQYIFVRDAYLSQREFLVNDGQVNDPFSDFDTGEWEEDWEEEF